MTEERRMIQDTAREFAMREVLPIANKLDPEQGEIPMSLRDKLAEIVAQKKGISKEDARKEIDEIFTANGV